MNTLKELKTKLPRDFKVSNSQLLLKKVVIEGLISDKPIFESSVVNYDSYVVVSTGPEVKSDIVTEGNIVLTSDVTAISINGEVFYLTSAYKIIATFIDEYKLV